MNGDEARAATCSHRRPNVQIVRRCESEGFVAGYHHIVVRLHHGSNEKLRRFVEGVSSVEGPDWQTIADKLWMLGTWEFEDHAP
jgi:hypothetical protein